MVGRCLLRLLAVAMYEELPYVMYASSKTTLQIPGFRQPSVERHKKISLPSLFSGTRQTCSFPRNIEVAMPAGVPEGNRLAGQLQEYHCQELPSHLGLEIMNCEADFWQ